MGLDTLVTLAELMTLLQRQNQNVQHMEYSSLSTYLKEIMYKPYPEGYHCLQFIVFDIWKGKPREHISHYINTTGQYAIDPKLRLKEFFKSLIIHAYT